MFVTRDTHKQFEQRQNRISLAATYDQGKIGFIPLAVMPPEPETVTAPVEEDDEEPGQRDED